MLDTQNLGSFCHLVAPDSADALSNDGKIQRRIEDVAPLTAGQGDHQNPMALVGIARLGSSGEITVTGARVAAPLLASSSGWAWTAISRSSVTFPLLAV